MDAAPCDRPLHLDLIRPPGPMAPVPLVASVQHRLSGPALNAAASRKQDREPFAKHLK